MSQKTVPGPSDGADEVLARRLASRMTVEELRSWCRRHQVRRRRGDDKLDTATRAVEQRPQAVVDFLAGA